MNLEALRAELPVLERVAYLNAGTFGPLPRRTAAAIAEQERAELDGGRSGAGYLEGVKELRQRARAGLAGLIGAASEHVALTRSTTEGCNIAVAGLALGPQDEIVTTDVEHFGLLGALGASPARVRVARVRERPAGEALAVVEGELGPHTRLVALSHASWVNGHVLPVAELARYGIPVLVDGAQSAGAIPVDVGGARLRLLHRLRAEVAARPRPDGRPLRGPGVDRAAPRHLSLLLGAGGLRGDR